MRRYTFCITVDDGARHAVTVDCCDHAHARMEAAVLLEQFQLCAVSSNGELLGYSVEAIADDGRHVTLMTHRTT